MKTPLQGKRKSNGHSKGTHVTDGMRRMQGTNVMDRKKIHMDGGKKDSKSLLERQCNCVARVSSS